MSAGNLPIVTDVGSTRKIATPGFSYYVPEKFSAEDIAANILSILKLNDAELANKMNSARNFVIKNFTIQSSADYFTSLYNKF